MAFRGRTGLVAGNMDGYIKAYLRRWVVFMYHHQHLKRCLVIPSKSQVVAGSAKLSITNLLPSPLFTSIPSQILGTAVVIIERIELRHTHTHTPAHSQIQHNSAQFNNLAPSHVLSSYLSIMSLLSIVPLLLYLICVVGEGAGGCRVTLSR